MSALYLLKSINDIGNMIRILKALDKFDYITTDEDDLKKINEILKKEGLEFFMMNGDMACNSLVGLVQEKVLLECDLLYGHDDGYGIVGLNKTTFEQWKPENWSSRIFKFSMIDKPNSPYGFLPNYRFWLMDPDSLGAMLYDPPVKDGSSCKEMAMSFRKILKLPFNIAVGVHFDQMDRDKFSKSLDVAWNWLDGKSLL